MATVMRRRPDRPIRPDRPVAAPVLVGDAQLYAHTPERLGVSMQQMEAERAAALKNGDLLGMLHAEAATHRLLSAAEEQMLARRMREGSPDERAEARAQFIQANIRLVGSIARYYVRQGRRVTRARIRGGVTHGARSASTARAREMEVLRRHIVDEETLDAIGGRLGVSRERARQIEQIAMKRGRRERARVRRELSALNARAVLSGTTAEG